MRYRPMTEVDRLQAGFLPVGRDRPEPCDGEATCPAKPDEHRRSCLAAMDPLRRRKDPRWLTTT